MPVLQRLLPVDDATLDAFCRRCKIVRLELFGSMLIDPEKANDIDLLVTFSPDARWGLLDHAGMENELAELLGRPVDLVSRRAVEQSHNPIRRESILSTAIPVYVRE